MLESILKICSRRKFDMFLHAFIIIFIPTITLEWVKPVAGACWSIRTTRTNFEYFWMLYSDIDQYNIVLSLLFIESRKNRTPLMFVSLNGKYLLKIQKKYAKWFRHNFFSDIHLYTFIRITYILILITCTYICDIY